MRIMIVDDHAGMRLLIKNVLESVPGAELDLLECESGEEAVSRYTSFHPDWVLMDVELKAMNGFQAIEEIYKKDAGANVVIVTSHDTPALRNRARGLHTRGFVHKDNLSHVNQILKTIS